MYKYLCIIIYTQHAYKLLQKTIYFMIPQRGFDPPLAHQNEIDALTNQATTAGIFID